MKHKKIILLAIFLLITSFLSSQNIDTLFILETNDVHGRIFSYNYYKDEPADIGLAQVYTRIKEYRQKHDHVLLVDAGDAIQGTPLTQYFNFVEPEKPHPMILAMNEMGYAAFAVGNHEIEQGPEVYNKTRDESNFPWLSANSDTGNGSTYFEPYTIIEQNGIKVGIIGLTTPGIPTMLDSTFYPGITWTDMVRTAKKYATMLRPKVDILAGLFHAGFRADEDAYKTEKFGLPIANASGLVAERIPEFDVVFGAHSHRIKPEVGTKTTETNRPLQIIARRWGECLGITKFILKRQNGKHSILRKSGWVEDVHEYEGDPELMELLKPYHEKTLDYIRNDIATITDTIYGANSRYEDSPIVELINEAQLATTGADISFAASFRTDYIFKQGKLQIKDVFTIYPYENYLFMVKMTGKQIKKYLEASSNYYIFDGEKVMRNPKIAGYHCSIAEGINYTIDPTKPVGKRIGKITMEKTGEPLKPNQEYKVALNSYRANGGGGLMKAAEATDAPIIYKSSQDMRNILIDYLQEIGELDAEVDNNWSLKY
ncbi:MAG: 5'-nucleotidase C-terminal domain-containing protein [Candidatus Cloacimonetes bacterium]|nr:5'-nucleotidase C-terminal domain-containing protein [Candidatus Cloacimonadota bacterium]